MIPSWCCSGLIAHTQQSSLLFDFSHITQQWPSEDNWSNMWASTNVPFVVWSKNKMCPSPALCPLITLTATWNTWLGKTFLGFRISWISLCTPLKQISGENTGEGPWKKGSRKSTWWTLHPSVSNQLQGCDLAHFIVEVKVLWLNFSCSLKYYSITDACPQIQSEVSESTSFSPHLEGFKCWHSLC